VGELDLDAYLARVGYGGPRRPDADTLRALHEAHVAAVPFENLDILLGRPISLELPALERKLVHDRRGGYCFEQNTLLRAALEGLGFTVTSLAARVRGGGILRPRTHMLLRVDLPHGPMLADVGFGGDGPVHPVPLQAGPETWTEGAGYRLRREDELWVLQGSLGDPWTDLYAFTVEPQHPVDFEMANHFTSTWPRSPFVQSLTAQRSWPGRRIILRNRDLTIREGGALRTEAVRDRDHLLALLAEHFGLAFPRGTRFSRPEF
jgi:N-hydroxyarylamine O-acetyltransferase